MGPVLRKDLTSSLGRMKNSPAKSGLLTAALFSAGVCWFASRLHYTGRAYGNHFTWIGWLLGMVLYLAAFVPWKRGLKRQPAPGGPGKDKTAGEKTVLLLLSFFFFFTHLWNFTTAPWNQNGLFDDAAWNVYFARLYIFSGEPFQAAFWQPGSSSAKGVIFHYYITLMFKLFGYNTLVFNLSVLLLAFFTYLFTLKLIYRLFNNHVVAVTAALFLNFLPLHFIHAFVGQRYAVAPLFMMISLYFLYTGFKNRSFFRVAVSSIAAGFCFTGAVMGKQYLLALALSVPLFLLFDQRTRQKIYWQLGAVFTGGLLIASLPMLMYMYYNPVYFTLEGGYLRQFFEGLFTKGLAGIKNQIDRAYLCFFGDFTWYRWFIPDFKLIPLPYYLFLLPGTGIALWKKRFEMLCTCLVSFGAAFVAGFSDYRILMVSPLWIIFMAYTVALLGKGSRRAKAFKYINSLLLAAVLLTGVLPCAKYLHEKSKDPYSVYYFAQREVVVSRFLRDIVAGVPEPSPAMRRNEFLRLPGVETPDYDTLICVEYGYAIPHTFLFDYDSEKVLSFQNQLPFNLISTEELLAVNQKAIADYERSGKNLKLIWELAPKSRPVVEKFKSLNKYGYDEVVEFSHAGRVYRFYILTVKDEHLEAFKAEVEKIRI